VCKCIKTSESKCSVKTDSKTGCIWASEVLKRQEVLETTDCLFSYDTIQTAQKTRPPAILRCNQNVFTELVPSNDREIHRHTRPTILLLLRVFFAAVTCLPSRCLATKGGIHFTEPLLRSDRKHTYTDTQPDRRDL
jgi:hypothetical protein